MFKQKEPYKQKYDGNNYVTIVESVNYKCVQDIEDRLLYLRDGQTINYSEFYKPTNNKQINQFISDIIETIKLQMITNKKEPVTNWISSLPLSFTIGVK